MPKAGGELTYNSALSRLHKCDTLRSYYKRAFGSRRGCAHTHPSVYLHIIRCFFTTDGRSSSSGATFGSSKAAARASYRSFSAREAPATAAARACVTCHRLRTNRARAQVCEPAVERRRHVCKSSGHRLSVGHNVHQLPRRLHSRQAAKRFHGTQGAAIPYCRLFSSVLYVRLQVLGMAFIIIVGAVGLSTFSGHFSGEGGSGVFQAYSASASVSFSGFGVAMIAALWAYDGWNQSSCEPPAPAAASTIRHSLLFCLLQVLRRGGH